MARKISVIIKRPGEKPYHTNISNTLAEFYRLPIERLVNGYTGQIKNRY